jgi:hypothetical protein
MKRVAIALAGATLLLSSQVRADEEFEHTAVRFEQNITDKDVEVVFEATSESAGMSALKIVAPNGRTVVDYRSPGSRLGIRHFKLESPELKNDGRLQKDFPEGEYTFTGVTVTGITLRGSAVLSHKLPKAPAIVRPRPEAKDVPVNGLQIRWDAAKDLAGVVVEIEQEKTNRKISATLPGSATTFTVPDGFLLPGTEYKLAIGAVSREGNISLYETEFTTGGKK